MRDGLPSAVTLTTVTACRGIMLAFIAQSLLLASGTIGSSWVTTRGAELLHYASLLACIGASLVAGASLGKVTVTTEHEDRQVAPWINLGALTIALLSLYHVAHSIPRAWVAQLWWQPIALGVVGIIGRSLVERRWGSLGGIASAYVAVAVLVIPLGLVASSSGGFHEWPRSLPSYQMDPAGSYRTGSAQLMLSTLPLLLANGWISVRRGLVRSGDLLLGALVVATWPLAA